MNGSPLGGMAGTSPLTDACPESFTNERALCTSYRFLASHPPRVVLPAGTNGTEQRSFACPQTDVKVSMVDVLARSPP